MIDSLEVRLGIMRLCVVGSVYVVLLGRSIADWIPWPDPGDPGDF